VFFQFIIPGFTSISLLELKRIGVWDCHATHDNWKTTIFKSIVYGYHRAPVIALANWRSWSCKLRYNVPYLVNSLCSSLTPIHWRRVRASTLVTVLIILTRIKNLKQQRRWAFRDRITIVSIQSESSSNPRSQLASSSRTRMERETVLTVGTT
jgi:hypothetical protein